MRNRNRINKIIAVTLIFMMAFTMFPFKSTEVHAKTTVCTVKSINVCDQIAALLPTIKACGKAAKNCEKTVKYTKENPNSAKPEISKKTATIQAGKTLKLKVKNAPKKASYKWTSGSPKIAAVNSKGKVTAKSKGTATIKVKVRTSKKTYTLTSKIRVTEKSKKTVYDRLIAMKKKYPEGMSWTNSDSYFFEATNTLGSGCAGFAFILSDAAFGKDAPVKQINSPKASKVRVGDILRINGNSHSVVVLKIKEKSFVIAEGNFNSSVHWGREISKSQNIDYLITRYK